MADGLSPDPGFGEITVKIDCDSLSGGKKSNLISIFSEQFLQFFWIYEIWSVFPHLILFMFVLIVSPVKTKKKLKVSKNNK